MKMYIYLILCVFYLVFHSPFYAQPITQVQEFTAIIQEKGWIHDAERINKKGIYSELERKGMQYFKDKPFYPVPFNNTMLKKDIGRTLSGADIELFKKVKSIWGYFYKDAKAKDFITDGVIEQWEFNNEQDAQIALNIMYKNGDTIYFNTIPFFCRIKNYVMVFQSRAMAFSYEQKPVYDLFVKLYNPVLPGK